MIWNTSISITLDSMDPKKFISLYRWDIIGISKIRVWVAVDIGITSNVEVMNMYKSWTIGRVVDHSIVLLVLPYTNMFWFNLIWLTLQGEREIFIRVAPYSIRCPRFFSKSTKYEATSTPNHCNGCTLVVTLVMKIFSLPSIQQAPIQDIKIYGYSILRQPPINLKTLDFGKNNWINIFSH